MADEPERRLIGALHAELERQNEVSTDRTLKHNHTQNFAVVGMPDSDGHIMVVGELDLKGLARAVLEEMEGGT